MQPDKINWKYKSTSIIKKNKIATGLNSKFRSGNLDLKNSILLIEIELGQLKKSINDLYLTQTLKYMLKIKINSLKSDDNNKARKWLTNEV